MDTTYERPTTYRDTWQASIPADTVKDAAKARAAYHRERERHWEEQEKEAATAYRESVQVREHEVTGGRQVAVAADAEKGAHLSDCKKKREDHQSKAEQYEGWVAFLAAMEPPNVRLQLTIRDATHFGIGLETVREDELRKER